ncbi:pyridoxal phosphate-dependent transferase [Macrophomina phaseolina]|uniref:Pyridoxal phosphate-dependent transferase n=1 Tax=Macrophomina phaseolina TaxID=35725 RepID=A0ABQ8G4C7_9PEZI|nr:pyridoxal phosphate-dependent transferase [Macrophomina phaseolina]
MLPPSRSTHDDAEAAKKSGFLHRSLRTLPLKVVGASGNYLTLSNGQQIFDATGGAAVSCLGHGDKRVQEAVMRQMNEAAYCHSLFFSTSAAEALGNELIAGTDGEMAKAFIVSSGSEAIEAAMKLARQYHLETTPPQPGRINFIARKESYHGTTLGSLSLGGHVARRALFEPMLLQNISRVSPCNAYRGKKEGESDEDYVVRLAKELDDEFQRLGPESVIAFVAEPVVGAALGCVPSVPGYFKAVKAICDKYGALLIMDEIMSGMGRTGTLHAWQQEGVVPDIQTIGKGLGGGYAPVAGLLINHRVVNALYKGTGSFSHGQTYQGHPMACAAAAEVQRIIREDKLCENAMAMGKYLEELLKNSLADHPNVGDIRGRGLFWGIEFVKDKSTKEPFDPKVGVAMGIHEKGMAPEYSISIYPGTGTADGKLGDHVLLAPAYNVTRVDVEKIVDLTAKVINHFFAGL